MSVDGDIARAKWLNLLVPGGGLILLGRTAIGFLIGVAFTALVATSALALLLIPDEFTLTARNLLITSAAAVYTLAQWLAGRIAEAESLRVQADRRSVALRCARQAAKAGDAQETVRCLQPIMSLAEHDLHVALRVAQAWTALGALEATEAWRRVQRLDRHHIYRAETARALETLPQLLRDGTA